MSGSKLGEAVHKWILDLLRDSAKTWLSRIFNFMNGQIIGLSDTIGQTPENWNTSVYGMAKNISETVILPIAAVILAYVFAVEVHDMFVDKNNMRKIEFNEVLALLIKMGVGAFLLGHTFDIVAGIFSVAQWAVNKAAAVATGAGNMHAGDAIIAAVETEDSISALIGICVMSLLIWIIMSIVGVLCSVICAGRFIEIYFYISAAPIPFATFLNRDWSQTGNNYLRGLASLGLQGLLMILCLSIYGALVANMNVTGDVIDALWDCVKYAVLLVFILFKTGTISKSILNAH